MIPKRNDLKAQRTRSSKIQKCSNPKVLQSQSQRATIPILKCIHPKETISKKCNEPDLPLVYKNSPRKYPNCNHSNVQQSQSTTIPICLENIYLKSVKFCPLNSPLIYNTDLKNVRLHLVILDYLGLRKRQRGGGKVVHVRDGIGNEQGNKHTPSTVNIFPFFHVLYLYINKKLSRFFKTTC